jgi:hypothetical protein
MGYAFAVSPELVLPTPAYSAKFDIIWPALISTTAILLLQAIVCSPLEVPRASCERAALALLNVLLLHCWRTQRRVNIDKSIHKSKIDFFLQTWHVADYSSCSRAMTSAV